MSSNIKRYSELQQLETFEERFNYLKLSGSVGVETFGFDRYINQRFYKDPRWKSIRDQVIVRDSACDLGILDREIMGNVYVHHMNPITAQDIINNSDLVFNPDYLICVSHETHNAIHYGDESYLNKYKIVDRTKNDQSPWIK